VGLHLVDSRHPVPELLDLWDDPLILRSKVLPETGECALKLMEKGGMGLLLGRELRDGGQLALVPSRKFSDGTRLALQSVGSLDASLGLLSERALESDDSCTLL